MVAGRGGDKPAFALLVREPRDEVDAAAHLERPDRLVVLVLDPRLGADELVERGIAVERGRGRYGAIRSRAASTSAKAGGSGGTPRRPGCREGTARVVVLGEPEQQLVQRLAVLGAERREELVLELPRQIPEPLELAPARVGDADDVAAPVLRVALPLDQAALLERVEEGDKPARVERERVGNRRLRLADPLVEDRQHAVVVDLEARLLEACDRLPLEAEAEPAEEETAACDQLLRNPMNRSGLGFREQDVSSRNKCSVEALCSVIVAEHNDWGNTQMSAEIVAQAEVGTQDSRRWYALALIVAAQFMVVLDVAIVNVALPSIRTDLHFSQESLQWVITAYSILFGGVLLLGGRLADLLGRRRLFMGGLAIFTVASLLDGFAWSEGSLIGFRAVQGLGAALLSPAALSILTTTFREGRERNVALGIWGAASGSGGAAGVLLGGALTSALGWSWIFFVNVPVGALVIALSPVLLRESHADLGHRRFDVAGATSITGGLMLLVYALTRATQHGWATGSTIGLLAASAGLVAAFFVIEARSQAPLLPLQILRLRTLTASNVSGLLMGGAIFAQFFLLTLYMQEVLHYSAIKTGVAYIGLTLTIIVFSAVAQAAVTRIGVRWVLPSGLALSTVALVLFARLPVHGDYFATCSRPS